MGCRSEYSGAGFAVPAGVPVVSAGYTLGASFTNYGTGHLLPQDRVVAAIISQNTRPVDGAESYTVVPMRRTAESDAGDRPGHRRCLSRRGIVEPAPNATKENGKVTGLDGYTTLNLGALAADPDLDEQWQELAVPINPDQAIYLKAQSPTRAAEVQSSLVYDKQ